MEDFRQILIRHWGYSEFRPLQLEIINSVAKGVDTLGLMPTGGGKSITFQVYSLSQEGICIVITPLIALMKDRFKFGYSFDLTLSPLSNYSFGSHELSLIFFLKEHAKVSNRDVLLIPTI